MFDECPKCRSTNLRYCCDSLGTVVCGDCGSFVSRLRIIGKMYKD